MHKQILVGAVLAALGASASAATISVNFLGNTASQTGSGFTNLNSTDTAGVVPVMNWNNANNQGTTGALTDSTGTLTSVTLTSNTNDAWYSSSGNASPDNTLLNGINKVKGGTGTSGSIVYNNVAPGTYTVDVELAENGAGSNGTLSVNGGTAQTVTEVAGATQTGPVTYTNNPNGANYVEFTGVTPDVGGAITLNFTHNSGTDGFGIAGIQLTSAASTPLPASAFGGAALIGGFALSRLRRKAR